MRKRSMLVRPSIEQLEDRSLLTGNVIVDFGAITSIKGDNNHNAVEISLGAMAGDVVFRGLNGTTVNGSSLPLVVQAPLGQLSVDLGRGDDLLVITNLSEASDHWPVASSPQAADNFVIAGDVSIAGGAGDDVVQLRRLDITGSLKVNTGAANDIIVAENVNVSKNLAISTGSGNDQVLQLNLNVMGQGTIKTGGGSDAMGVLSTNLQKQGRFLLGGGDDTAWIESNVLQQINLNGGGGSDELTENFETYNVINGRSQVSNIEHEDLELTADVHFGYEGEIGPDFWGELTPAFLLSEVGRQQSPVNIVTDDLVEIDLPEIDISYLDNLNLAFAYNGHTIQVAIPVGNTITVAGDTYELQQIHFHASSEHLVNGQGYPLEMHLVHQDADGNLLVLGVFIEAGATNAAFDGLIANLPDLDIIPNTVIPGPLNPENLLPEDRAYYAYNGSLTTPPASERVSFAIFAAPVELSVDQIAAIVAAIGEPNARPVQPVNDRQIFAEAAHG